MVEEGATPAAAELARHGITGRAIISAYDRLHAVPVIAASILLDGDTFIEDRTGFAAWVTPVTLGGVTVDRIAFRPTRPAQWWSERGAAILGEDAAISAALSEMSIRLFRTPLAWLCAGCDGAVILGNMWPLSLRAEIVPEDRDHARDIAALHRRNLTPRLALRAAA
ncbi:hypothetical protein [Oceanibacterium hippocampi]|uniref:Uncharacterized protein n=1 Tax=Oceanibacterium hippocampi TaxID=745714 RepID=A0A1Y5U523_9PROT|nr:hypothetical protein [Oceanibacterium hippocampi]SLN77379.1 hypothetical protein OCH7691_04395 [Oceanibacterium hippocampi]